MVRKDSPDLKPDNDNPLFWLLLFVAIGAVIVIAYSFVIRFMF